MRAIILPGKANGIIQAPPSKSMAHRILMASGLAEGTSIIRNIDLSEDVKATLGILENLGCQYTMDQNTIYMEGIGGKPIIAKGDLYCNESGSTLRFFIPLLLIEGKPAKFVGAKRLFERPLDIYQTICEEQEIRFEKMEAALEVEGTLKAMHYRVPGGISSQFLTGLLFALPLLKEDSVLEILPPIESSAYIDMTIETLKMYGIQLEQKENCIRILGNQRYHAKDCEVEGDYSNAAFLDALGLIGGTVSVTGLREQSLQGDQIYKIYFEQLKEENPELDISECPDLGPILMGLAAAGKGAVLTGTRRLRMKESDRGVAMAQELKKFGIEVQVEENKIIVAPGNLCTPKEMLCGHNDHRIVMTLATLCTITGGTIDGCEAVRKSFPQYFDVIARLGINIKIEK